ncbi:uncharacterized protein [Haliotis asinina]|uniref:uncharacterized protein n=1 Tax=Haliotis asinina TaxID=109174 RepID=UPI003531FF8E
MEIEKEKELELERFEMEKEIQLKKLQVDREIALKKLENPSHTSDIPSFDIARHARLVPPFNEKEVDKYFLHFEKVAENLKWPRESWTMLLQTVLKGKAQDAYSALSVQQSSDYDLVKSGSEKSFVSEMKRAILLEEVKYMLANDIIEPSDSSWSSPCVLVPKSKRDRAKKILAFTKPDGLYQYKAMPFGLKNTPATFQRLVNNVTSGLDRVEAYMDDVMG